MVLSGPVQGAIAAAATLLLVLPWLVVPHPLVPLGLAAGILIVLAALMRPLLACLAFVMLSLFRIHEAYPFLAPLQLPLAFAGLTWLALAYQGALGRIRPVWSRELRFFGYFFAVATFAAPLAVSPVLSLETWTGIYYKIGLMTLALAWLVRTPRDFQLTARSIVVSGLLISVAAIHNTLVGMDLVEGTRVTIARATNSILGDPNDLAFLLLITLSFSIGLLTSRSGALNTLLGAVGAPTTLWAITYTQSRGGMLGVMTVLGIYGLRLVRSKLLLAFLAIPAAGALYLGMGIADRDYGVEADDEGLDASAAGRLQFWAIALRAAVLRPLTGVGIGNFPWFNYLESGAYMVSHNTWLEVLAETGWPGLALFVLMVVSAFRSSVAGSCIFVRAGDPPIMPRFALALTASLAGYCVAGSFLSQGFTWPIYLMVALTTAVGRRAQESANAPERS